MASKMDDHPVKKIDYEKLWPKNLIEIQVKPTKQTICRLDPNSLYKGTAYWPEDPSKYFYSSDTEETSECEESDEKKMNFLQPRDRPTSQLRQVFVFTNFLLVTAFTHD